MAIRFTVTTVLLRVLRLNKNLQIKKKSFGASFFVSYHIISKQCIPISCLIIGKSLFQSEAYIDIFPGEDSDNARFFKEHRLRPKTMYTTTDSHSACAMVEAGLGIALNNALNSHGRSSRLKVVPLHPRQYIEIGLAVRRGTSPAVAKFAERIIDRLWKEQ